MLIHTQLYTKGKNQMGNETLVSLNLEPTDLEILGKLAGKANQTTETYLVNLIREKANKTLLSAGELSVATLELVWQHILDHSADFDAVRVEVAGDLLVARVTLALSKNGKVDPEQVKVWAEELYT